MDDLIEDMQDYLTNIEKFGRIEAANLLIERSIEALKPVENDEVQDWIKYRRASSQTFKMLDVAEQLLLRLAQENKHYQMTASPSDYNKEQLTLARLRIKELERENAAWQNQNLAQQCHDQAARIEELEEKSLNNHAKLVKQLDYTSTLRNRIAELEAEIKEWRGCI